MKMETPAVFLAQTIHEVLYALVKLLAKNVRFESLRNAMQKAAKNLLDDQLKITIKAITEHLLIETNMICTSDAKFRNMLLVIF